MQLVKNSLLAAIVAGDIKPENDLIKFTVTIGKKKYEGQHRIAEKEIDAYADKIDDQRLAEIEGALQYEELLADADGLQAEADEIGRRKEKRKEKRKAKRKDP